MALGARRAASLVDVVVDDGLGNADDGGLVGVGVGNGGGGDHGDDGEDGEDGGGELHDDDSSWIFDLVGYLVDCCMIVGSR